MNTDTRTQRSDLFKVLVAYVVCIAAAVAALPLLPWSPLVNALVMDVIATVVIFGFSRWYGNSSLYDAYWSVMPPLLVTALSMNSIDPALLAPTAAGRRVMNWQNEVLPV